MAINPAPLPIQFSGGVDTRTEEKQIPTTKLKDLQNCVFTKLSTLSKRDGYAAKGTQIQNGGGTLTGAKGIGERDGEILVFTDKRCYSQRTSTDQWADTGEVAATTATTLPIARTGTQQTQPDIATRNGVSVMAFEDNRGGVWCSVIEADTGRILLSQFQLDASASAHAPRCLAVGDVLHVLWTRVDIGSIQIAVINPATPASAPTISTLTSDLNTTNPFYDALSAPNGDSAVFNLRPGLIAWVTAGVGFRVGWIAPSGVLGSPLTGLASAATFSDAVNGPIAISWEPIFGAVGVAWASASASGVMARFLVGNALSTVSRTATLGPGVIAFRLTCAFGGIASDGSPLFYWAAEVTTTRTDLTIIISGATIQSNSALDAVMTTLRGHGLVSRAFHDGPTVTPTGVSAANENGDVYVMVAHTVRFFPYVAALRLSDDQGITTPTNTIVSRLIPGEASGSLMRTTGPGTFAWTQHLPSAIDIYASNGDIYSRTHAVCIPYRIQLSSQNGDQFSEQGIKLCTLNFNVGYQSVQLGRGLYLSSSAPMHYDGDAWHEADFHAAPDIGFDTTGAPVALSTLISIVGGGSIAAGTYLYKWWYEVVDAQGELHRGPTSTGILVTMTGTQSFSMTLPTCRLTKFSSVRICVARSAQGATGTSNTIPLFRVTANDVTVTTGSNRYVNNDPTADTVTFVDGLSDAVLITREPLYTNGGVLSNAPSPWGGDIIAVGKSRLYWNDSTNPHLIRYSQQIADDTALEAPIDLSLIKDPFGGPLTAIGVMDDTIIPFSRTAAYVFGGPGPDAAPGLTANAFAPVELVSTDVGCTQAASVGYTAVGLTFKSAKGIMLLTRDRQIQNIGNDVQAYDSQNVVSSTLIPSAQRIVYLTDAGRTLMWDYNRVQWSTFTNHTGLGAVILNGLYCYLRNDSRVFVQTPGVYLDDNAQIPMVIETAWIHFAQYLQGWQRLLYAYFLGRFLSAHTLSVRIRYDYNESYSPAILSNVNANYNPSAYGSGTYGGGDYGGSGGDSTRYQRRIHLNRRCQSVSFQISDIEATGDAGASFELSELLLLGGGIGPDFKIGAARSA